MESDLLAVPAKHRNGPMCLFAEEDEMGKAADRLLKELSIPEKAALLEGYESWMTNAVPRLGIPAIHLTDGPVGLRKRAEDTGEGVLGLGQSCPSTAFPTSVSVANSWDPENAERMGRAIGEECRAYDVQVLLGPALNIKRDPRCGRNFEYYSEDPLLAGRMAAAFVRGVQSTGTAACAKHFALNNCENHRYMSDSVIDERAAREIYLKAFEICVREGHPHAMMCAYNKVNGTHCSENRWLLTDVLRGEWGFDGMTMTDWGATRDRVEGLKAGLDLDMPGGIQENRQAIIEAAENGSLPMEVLDQAVLRVLRTVAAGAPAEDMADLDNLLTAHHEMAAGMAEDGAVLLANDGTLPLAEDTKVLAVGDLFRKMRYQGAGSSGLNPARLVTTEDAFRAAGTAYQFAAGYREDTQIPDPTLEAEALTAAKDADVILFFGGLTELFESEGYDREDLSMPSNQLQLIDQLCGTGKKVVAVLFGGSPMELPFADRCAAILHMFLPGQGGGQAVRRLLYGEADPGGRLSETWMTRCADIPGGEYFSKGKIEEYRENIYVGYRYFDRTPERIRYPFGFGLSYTTFSYEDLQVSRRDGTVTALVTVKNTGERAGAEVVQLYVGNNADSRVFKAEKELRAFQKIFLQPGESRTVELVFPERDLAYYHTGERKWIVENGKYRVLAGSSSWDIHLTQPLILSGYPQAEGPYSERTLSAYAGIAARRIPDDVFAETIGRRIPEEPPVRPYTLESPISDFQNSRMGQIVYRSFLIGISSAGRKVEALPDGPQKEELRKNQRFIVNLVPRNSPRSLIQSGGGITQMKIARAITETANGHLIRAVKELLAQDSVPPLPCESEDT